MCQELIAIFCYKFYVYKIKNMLVAFPDNSPQLASA